MTGSFKSKRMVEVRLVTILSILGVSLVTLAQEDLRGFISIDSGFSDGDRYQDMGTGLMFSPDSLYVESGTPRTISESNSIWASIPRYQTLRSFPNGTRNCYTINKGLVEGDKYLVRASFLYGNYDGENSTPLEFDLYLDYKFWQTIKFTDGVNAVIAEIVTIVPSSSILWVCLVNTGKGVPFMNILELRQLNSSMYPAVNTTVSLVLQGVRFNLGAQTMRIRYPFDTYDRMWWWWNMSYSGWINISATSGIDKYEVYAEGGLFNVPSAVLATAVTPSDTPRIDFQLGVDQEGDRYKEKYVAMYFTEFNDTESRTFNVFLNNKSLFPSYKPPYLQLGVILMHTPNNTMNLDNYTFSLIKAANSTLPPILNALEVYKVMRISDLPTSKEDVNGIMGIKEQYKVKRNWMGDPCNPTAYIWDGLNCAYTTSDFSRILTLNLSSFGLTGEISPNFAGLTSLKSLDLSFNSLTGPLPEFLVNLTSLKLLNVTGNQLSGLVPPALLNRSQHGLLVLRIEDNPNLCTNENSCEKRKIRWIVPVTAAVPVVVLLIVALIIWRLRKRGLCTSTCFERFNENDCTQLLDDQGNLLQINLRRFTYIELEKITNKFESVIGQGGFGTVYHARLENAFQVAVKMLSHSSRQGAKEFIAEVTNLSKVHHRNLLSLVGYCRDRNHLALVYDYMSEGSLHDHLRGKTCSDKVLRWVERLRIVYEAAQGLDYLHRACQPSILHRDVKTSNILLNEKLEAKLSDFGLSRNFQSDDCTHISTAIAGTPGYVDPEYNLTNSFNQKSDVYSFGVVLLVVITGQPQILRTTETVHLTEWVTERLANGNIGDVVDRRLRGQYDGNSVCKVIDLALACTSMTSIERPWMSNVVEQLKESLSMVAASDSSCHISMEDGNLSQASAPEISSSDNAEDFTTLSAR